MNELSWLMNTDIIQKALPLDPKVFELMHPKDIHEMIHEVVEKYLKKRNEQLEKIETKNWMSRALLRANFSTDAQVWLADMNRILLGLIHKNKDALGDDKFTNKTHIIYNWLIMSNKARQRYFMQDTQTHPVVKGIQQLESQKSLDQIDALIIDLINQKGE